MLDSIVAFISDPAKTSFVVTSILISIGSLIFWKKYQAHALLYAHLFFLIAPLFYFAFSINCAMGLISGIEEWCAAMLVKFILYILPLTMVATFTAGQFAIPLFYKKSAKKFSNKQFAVLCKKTKLGATLWLLDKAKPVAFTIGKNVFVSVGLFETLSKREQEAVLLHELYHVKARSSWAKFSAWFVHVFSPLAWFSSCSVAKEEIKADAFAISIQGTKKHILYAKKKLS